MDHIQAQIDELKAQMKSVDEKLDSILELVQMGRGIMMLAKVGAWAIGAAFTCVELWRQFIGPKV